MCSVGKEVHGDRRKNWRGEIEGEILGLKHYYCISFLYFFWDNNNNNNNLLFQFCFRKNRNFLIFLFHDYEKQK